MNKIRINSVISWVLLAYFALFIVPPVSTFASSHGARASAADQETSLVQDRHQAPLLLLDIVVWQQLKKAKHSEEFLAESFDDPGFPTTIQSPDNLALIQRSLLSSGRFHFPDDVHQARQSRSSDIRFSRSGTSPPTSSS